MSAAGGDESAADLRQSELTAKSVTAVDSCRLRFRALHPARLEPDDDEQSNQDQNQGDEPQRAGEIADTECQHESCNHDHNRANFVGRSNPFAVLPVPQDSSEEARSLEPPMHVRRTLNQQIAGQQDKRSAWEDGKKESNARKNQTGHSTDNCGSLLQCQNASRLLRSRHVVCYVSVVSARSLVISNLSKFQSASDAEQQSSKISHQCRVFARPFKSASTA
jgi:hypothetical protein